MYKIPRKTLRRHRDRKVNVPGCLGRSTDIPLNMENELVEKIQEMEKLLFRLTPQDVRRIAYEFAEKSSLEVRFDKTSKMAGKDWLWGFMNRHPELSVRSPEATSLARAVGFNRPQVQKFFDLYGSVLDAGGYGPMSVWNMDETGVSTVQTPGKIVASRGVKRVGKVTSAERGKTVTVLCACNAGGTYVPPVFVFGRARMVDSLMNGAPPGAIGTCTKSGWTDQDVFLLWFCHFLSVVKASADNKQILILDGHHSHKSLKVITMARENGVTIITLPPHSTHRMQPLDVAVFKSLKTAYNNSVDTWMRSNPGRRVSEYEVAKLFSTAYTRSATMDRAINGFRVTGLWPNDVGIFSDEDFVASHLTDEAQSVGDDPEAGIAAGVDVTAASPPEPRPGGSGDAVEVDVAATSPPEPRAGGSGDVAGVEVAAATSPPEPRAGGSGDVTGVEVAAASLLEPQPGDFGIAAGADVAAVSPPEPKSAGITAAVDVAATSPPGPRPVGSGDGAGAATRVILQRICMTPKAEKRKRNRRTEQAKVLTSSPNKRALEEKAAKAKTAEKKTRKSASKGKKKVEAPDDTTCVICGMRFIFSCEEWVQCEACRGWACVPCTDIEKGEVRYTCDLCRE